MGVDGRRALVPLAVVLIALAVSVAFGALVARPVGSRPPEQPSELGGGGTPGSRLLGLEGRPIERPEVELPPPSMQDLWAMRPGDAGLAELDETSFRLHGGVRSEGTDPEGARAEVSSPEWAERQEAELRRDLEGSIAFGGARIERLSCGRGRCLVELSFDSMATGIERSQAVRRLLTERVRCPSYTEGPDETESPTVRPSQQIWILCGEPDGDR